MKIIVQSPHLHNYPAEQQIVTELFRNGLSAYHLDKPYFKSGTMEQFIAGIPAPYHKRIVLHSHHELVKRFDLAGLHCEREPKPAGLLGWWQQRQITPHLKGKDKTTSCRDLAEVGALADLSYSYVLCQVEPDSLCGEDPAASGSFVRNALMATSLRLIAVGENGPGYVQRAMELGFFGAALNRSIWDQRDPVASYQKIVEACREVGGLVE
jgi:thiamine-phosphate pyrophosphorylase